MTNEELDRLCDARSYITDAEYGIYSIDYYRDILQKLKDHKAHGTPTTISCTIDFIKQYVQIDADILIKIYEDKIAEYEKKVAECKALIEHAQL